MKDVNVNYVKYSPDDNESIMIKMIVTDCEDMQEAYDKAYALLCRVTGEHFADSCILVG